MKVDVLKFTECKIEKDFYVGEAIAKLENDFTIAPDNLCIKIFLDTKKQACVFVKIRIMYYYKPANDGDIHKVRLMTESEQGTSEYIFDIKYLWNNLYHIQNV